MTNWAIFSTIKWLTEQIVLLVKCVFFKIMFALTYLCNVVTVTVFQRCILLFLHLCVKSYIKLYPWLHLYEYWISWYHWKLVPSIKAAIRFGTLYSLISNANWCVEFSNIKNPFYEIVHEHYYCKCCRSPAAPQRIMWTGRCKLHTRIAICYLSGFARVGGGNLTTYSELRYKLI